MHDLIESCARYRTFDGPNGRISHPRTSSPVSSARAPCGPPPIACFTLPVVEAGLAASASPFIKEDDMRPQRQGQGLDKWLAWTALMLVSMVFAGPALAQNYPARPVTIIVGLPPGGITDWMSRVLAQQLTDKWKQSVIVENKVGAGGKIADEYAMHAAPDGYTLLNATSIIGARTVFDKDA